VKKMLKKKSKDNRYQVEMKSVEDLVPQDHLLRKIDKKINFDFIYGEVKGLYSKAKGRPSIDPVVLIKILLIQYIHGIPSIRQTIKEIQVNVAYRWFLGYSLSEKLPHFSTIGKNYERRFKKEPDLFNKIFIRILKDAEKHGFISSKIKLPKM
jgi:transposase